MPTLSANLSLAATKSPLGLKNIPIILRGLRPPQDPEDAARWWKIKALGGAAATVLCLLAAGLLSLVEPPAFAFTLLLGLSVCLQITLGLPAWRGALRNVATDPGPLVACIAALVATFCQAEAVFIGRFFPADAATLFTAAPAALTLTAAYFHARARGDLAVRNREPFLRSLRVDNARRLAAGGQETLPTDNLKPGDTILVRPGEKIPRDGLVVKGTTSVDESALIGEFRPLLKESGDKVVGGSLNRDGDIHVRIETPREEDVLEVMIRRFEAALEGPCPLSQIAAALNGLAWLLAAAAVAAPFVAVALAGWPWARALAASLSLAFAAPAGSLAFVRLSRRALVVEAARKGIVFMDARYVEKLARVTSVFFNKTGTLSLGDFTFSQCFIEAGTNQGDFLSTLFSLEQFTDHPLAGAMATHPWFVEIPLHPIKDEEEHPGLGISAVIGPRGGRPYLAANGNLRFMKRMRFNVSRDMKAKVDDLEEMGETVVLCGYDRQVRGVISFSDTLRKGVRRALREIQKLGVETALITGDTEKTVTQLTGSLGIEKIHSRCTPEEKAAKIAKEKQSGLVALVDSDLSDNPALKAADLSLSLDTGTTIKRHPANILLMGSDVSLLPWILEKARARRRWIAKTLNLQAACAVLAAVAALSGFVPPAAVAAMSFIPAALAFTMNEKKMAEV